jgi:hypothetical protein
LDCRAVLALEADRRERDGAIRQDVKYAVRGEAQAERPRQAEVPSSSEVGLVLLVPRQLARAGMTGDVPYYGGRFTPAQAYAASHARQTSGPPASPPHPVPPLPPAMPAAQLEALRRLRDDGVISASEHDDLASRVTG